MSKGFGKPISTDQADKRASKGQAVLDADEVQREWLGIFSELEDSRVLNDN